ncbi:fec operon regulator FecR [Pigmentiphaga humi]|uniref:Fec operon regulator FecR n=1 Tax=Pigmentiphaga humi TaxID=2478468 RepID=A0A3P4B7Z6_9BURK|nr:FecR domain-containing protein [Pigmentiphaga humi]VCU71750.1 fec operon regulator FecR [Pigmentiphaga humi]
MSRSAIAEEIVEQAAEWQVLLSSHAGTVGERQALQARYEAWKHARPEHAQAAGRLERLIGDVRAATCTPVLADAGQQALAAGRRVVRRHGKARRMAGAALLALAVAVPAAWLPLQHYSLGMLLADFHTQPGAWRTVRLADGTSLTLGSASAANYRYDAGRRELELVQGQLMVDVAKDASRPFTVVTPEARITALGTRFAVTRHEGMTELFMLESEVRVQAAGTPAVPGLVVRGGQRVRIWADRVGAVQPLDVVAAGNYWHDRRLVVDDMPLPQVLDLLARERPGLVSFDRQALARYSVSGVLDLGDPERAMQLLATSFPIRVRSFGPWLIRIDPMQENPPPG